MHDLSSLSGGGIPIIDTIAGIANGREAWLVDIWGVMHNGITAFLPASDACRTFRLGGGTVILLSNAPRPAQSVAAQLERIGVPREAFDGIVSSGDAARATIASLPSRAVFHLGPERDLALFEGLDVQLVAAGAAAAVVCTGLFDDETETPEHYQALLEELAGRGLPMICANPDITVERGGRIIYCAGALAKAYEALGGRATYAGKPHPPVYEMAFATIRALRGRPVLRTRVLAIGDGLHTDIAGAQAAGIDSVYIASPVHLEPGRSLDTATIAQLFTGSTARPLAAMTALVW